MRCLLLCLLVVASALAQDKTTAKPEGGYEYESPEDSPAKQPYGKAQTTAAPATQASYPTYAPPAQPAYAQPASAQPASAQPAYAQPAYAQPAYAQAAYPQAYYPQQVKETTRNNDERVSIPVPTPYPVTYERKIPFTVNKPYPVTVPRAVPISVAQPYPVPVPRAVPVEIPRAVAVAQPYAVPTYAPAPAAFAYSSPLAFRQGYSFPAFNYANARFAQATLFPAGFQSYSAPAPAPAPASAYFGPQVIYNGAPAPLLSQSAVTVAPKQPTTAYYNVPAPQSFANVFQRVTTSPVVTPSPFANVFPTTAPVVTPSPFAVSFSPAYDGPSHGYLPPSKKK